MSEGRSKEDAWEGKKNEDEKKKRDEQRKEKQRRKRKRREKSESKDKQTPYSIRQKKEIGEKITKRGKKEMQRKC